MTTLTVDDGEYVLYTETPADEPIPQDFLVVYHADTDRREREEDSVYFGVIQTVIIIVLALASAYAAYIYFRERQTPAVERPAFELQPLEANYRRVDE